MASLIDCLIEDLTNENDGYEKLLDLSNDKTSAIVSGNVEKLQEIFIREQKLTAVNENNKLLLKESMDMIQFELDLAKNAVLKPQTGNYGRTAYEEAEITGATGFDAKQ